MCARESWCAVCAGGGLYHPVPPSNLRSLQSRNYLSYIEGLGNETMSDWKKELSPTASLLGGEEDHVTIPPWLEKLYTSEHTRGVESFCALRDFMLQEALNVVKFA